MKTIKFILKIGCVGRQHYNHIKISVIIIIMQLKNI